MEHRDSLADQAATWVPPWERDAAAAGSSGPADASAAEPAAPEAGSAPDNAAPPSATHPTDDAGDARSGEPAPPPEGVSPARAEHGRADDTAPDQGTALALVDDAELAAALEAIMLVVDEPVAETTLAEVLEQPVDRVAAALAELSARYTDRRHGFDLRRAAGGWRLYTRPEYASYVERFVLGGQQARLTQAALETLAVVAYKQPVTRSRISAIRGVNCDGVIRTLVSRGLVEECGTEPETGAYLYRTTTFFLEKLGLDSVDELPALAPFLPDDVEEFADEQR